MKFAEKQVAAVLKMERGEGHWHGSLRQSWVCNLSLIVVLFSELSSFAQLASEVNRNTDSDLLDPITAEGIQTGPGGRLMRETANRAASEGEKPYHLHFVWESRYVSEGRDNLSGAGFATVATDLSFGLLTFSPWYADSYDTDYDELNLNIVLGFQPSEYIEVYAGYTHLRFFEDHLYDNEIGAGVVLKYLELADFFATATYSFEAGGSFVETGFSREISVSDQLTLQIAALLGLNSGYVWDGHNGANNAQLMMEASYAINASLEFMLFAGQTWAIGSDVGNHSGDETLGDSFWGGGGLIIHF